MPKPSKPKYRTTNWNAYNEALKRRGSLELWFDPGMAWLLAACGKRGRPQRFSDRAIEFCLTMKVLFRLPLRQVTGFVASLLKMAGLDWPVPDYTTLSRRQKKLQVSLDARACPDGLHLLVDSTGIKMVGEGEWKTRKHGASYRRQWRKVHLGIDARTLDIHAIEVTTNAVGDAPMLPKLLAQIPDDETVVSVSGDGAYDTRKCHGAIAGRNAEAIIPVRRNGRSWTKEGPGVEGRNEALRATRRFGRAIWKNWSGYHRRSLVETKMSCFKRLGQRVTARTFDRQINELKIRAKVLNQFSKAGTPITVRVK